jgi:hypothetical protein
MFTWVDLLPDVQTVAVVQAWAADTTFDAWVVRWGSPQEAAGHLAADPRLRLGALAQHLPHDLTGGCGVDGG